MRSTAARSPLALRLSFSLRPASRHPSGPCSLLWSIPMVKLIAIDGTAARALRCLRRGSSKFSLWRGNNSLRRLRDEEDFRHRCARHIADKRRDRCAGAIQSESDGGHRHGGEPRTDAVRSLYPWGSRVWVLAALAPPMALVSPALVICRNGFQRRYCNQLMSFMTGSGQAPHTGAVSLSAYRGWRAPLPRRKSTNPPADSCDRELT